MKNYYQTLKIDFDASSLEIKKAYRVLALKFHPDVNTRHDAHEKFIEIVEAYEVLINSVSRKKYDKIYENYFKNSIKFEAPVDESVKNQQYKWAENGQNKAKEYSSINYEVFARMLLKEVSTGMGYLPNLIAIIVALGFASLFLEMFLKFINQDVVYAIFPVIMIFLSLYLAYKLFRVAQRDYFNERKNSLKT